jgi:hypothetical protein
MDHDKIEAVRELAFKLSCEEQYRLAFFIAENIGYVLEPDPLRGAPEDSVAMTHSPFPWRTHPQNPTGIFDAGGNRIANTAGTSIKVDYDTAADNAALIAAMPGLVEALTDAVHILRAVRLSSGLGKGQIARLEKMEAALASIGRGK